MNLARGSKFWLRHCYMLKLFHSLFFQFSSRYYLFKLEDYCIQLKILLLFLTYVEYKIVSYFSLFQKLLETIKNHGIKLATLNADVHRFTLDTQDNEDFMGCSLKTDISELYELFENTRTW